jgi:hypothetical protein
MATPTPVSSSADRRGPSRVPVAFPARGDDGTRYHAVDLSLGGARLRGGRGRAVGTPFDLTLDLPTEGASLRLKAVVVGATDSQLHVRFVRTDRRALVRLAEAMW